MVRMGQGRLNKRVFDRIREYKSVGGRVKQMREETEKFLWKIKKNGRVLRGRRKGSKDTQK